MATDGVGFMAEGGDDPAGAPVVGNGVTGPNPVP
jgi:hypothetical protein